MAGFAGALWRLEQYPPAFLALVGKWRLGNEYVMIDATIVRAYQHGAGARKKGVYDQAIGRSRGGLTTKSMSSLTLSAIR